MHHRRLDHHGNGRVRRRQPTREPFTPTPPYTKWPTPAASEPSRRVLVFLRLAVLMVLSGLLGLAALMILRAAHVFPWR